MNALGLILARKHRSMRQASPWSGFGLSGLAAMESRRRAALAAGSSLVIMALVSIIVLSPWPQWWIVARTEPGGPRQDRPRSGPLEKSRSRPGRPGRHLVRLHRRSAVDASTRTKPLVDARLGSTASSASCVGPALDPGPRATRDGAGGSGSRSGSSSVWPGPGTTRPGILGHPSIASTEPADRGPRFERSSRDPRAELSCSRKVEVRETSD